MATDVRSETRNNEKNDTVARYDRTRLRRKNVTYFEWDFEVIQ